jgi:SAM-dependent methyltransferase
MAEPIEWEEAACLVCRSVDRADSDSVTWRDAAFRYVLCRTCGLKYMNPRPTERWYHAFYEQEFWQEKIEYRGFTQLNKAPRTADEGLAKRLAKQRWRAERILQLTGRHVPLDQDSLVVDVGAAFGVTLHTLQDRFGCRVAGVEPSSAAREYAERELGVSFIGRYMEDLLHPGPLDGRVMLVLLSQVLENIVNPRAALRAVARLVGERGYVYIDTSNFFYYNAINPYHPYIFSPDTLEDLLAQCGFRVTGREHAPLPAAGVETPDPFLMFVAQPGPSAFVRTAAPVDELAARQRLGLQMMADRKAAKARR